MVLDILERSIINHRMTIVRYIIKRLMNVDRKIFGTRSYGGETLTTSVDGFLNICPIKMASLILSHVSHLVSMKMGE